MSDLSHLSDRELLKNKPLDSERMAELISRYMNIVFPCAKRYSDRADYDELVSDGMAGLLDAVQNYDEQKGEFSAFVYVCVRNRMRNTVKRASRYSAGISDNSEEELETIPDPAPTPEEAVIAGEDSSSLMESIRSELTELELRCIQGMVLGLSYDEIAKRIGCDRKSVDNALCRARNKLRRFYMG